MDRNTRKVLSRIAFIQLEALQSIKDQPDTDLDLARAFLQVKDNEWESQLQSYMDTYKQMIEIPSIIRCLNEYQLLVCSHILYKIEESEIMVYNSQGVFGAWQEIHKAMLKFHPEFTLTRV